MGVFNYENVKDPRYFRDGRLGVPDPDSIDSQENQM